MILNYVRGLLSYNLVSDFKRMLILLHFQPVAARSDSEVHVQEGFFFLHFKVACQVSSQGKGVTESPIAPNLLRLIPQFLYFRS